MPLLPVEELHSRSRSARARIFRRPDGLYEVELEIYVKGSEPHDEPHWWSPLDGTTVVTDSLESARKLAQDGILRAEPH